ncbi:MAG: Smr/MutS family protein [Flavobacteriales bacterium]
MAKHTLDLHDIFNKGKEIDRALDEAMEYCVDRRIPLLEIIPGKGSGQLKKKVLRYLQQPQVKKLYHRIDKDSDNFGRLFVRFKH